MHTWNFLAVFGCFVIGVVTPAIAEDTKADWLHRPTREELRAIWPRKAAEKGVDGSAKVRCTVSVQGALSDCLILREDPKGMGFGDAAIALTPQFLMKPPTHNGQPYGGETVDIPVNFAGPEFPSFLGRTLLSHIQWLAAPTYADVVAAYPAKAREENVSGHASLDCEFARNGRLDRCEVIAEEPKGMGFAKAAKSLVGGFVGPITYSGGKPTLGKRTTIAFAFPIGMLSGGDPLIGRPSWTQLPELADPKSNYPPEARTANVKSGDVVLSCLIGEAGRIRDCAAESQQPAGFGFGESALALSSDLLVNPWTEEGLPTVGGRVWVPVRFRLEGDHPLDVGRPETTASRPHSP